MRRLPAKLQQQPFTVRQAAHEGLSFYDLSQLVSAGSLEQLSRGIYRVSGIDISEEDQFRMATLRVRPPSAICLISALSYYHLTDIIPKKTWIMVPANKRTSDPGLKLYRTRNPNWDVGIEKHRGYAITTVERTLVECLTQRSRLGTPIGLEALRLATKSKATTLSKVVDIAKELKLLHRIFPYIEALA
jgi:predicted transcriptional regulator of viral defense system